MKREPTTPQDALELTLLNRKVAPGFTFGYRSTGKKCCFILIDTSVNTIHMNSSLAALRDIYTNRLQQIAGADFFNNGNHTALSPLGPPTRI
jgi:hypothetical protein